VERDREQELVRIFGNRFRRIYAVETAALPDQIAGCLDDLERSEQARRRQPPAEMGDFSTIRETTANDA